MEKDPGPHHGDVPQEGRKRLPTPPPSTSPMADKAKGRSSNYDELSPSEQWEEDKQLGILDWDGS